MDNQNNQNNQFPWTYSMPPYEDDRPAQKKPKTIGAGKIIAIALVCSILGGILGAGCTLLVQKLVPEQEAPAFYEDAVNILQGIRKEAKIQVVEVPADMPMTPAEVYAANVQSTVGLTTSITTNFWGYQTTSAASGSGFILSSDGYILTNYHVVEDSSAITVALYDGTTYEATLIGYDSSNDIAVLKVEAENLSPVVIGDSDNMNVGDSVLAIGNPLGELTFSLTAGTVSALDRQVTMSTGSTMELIQTDCAINSGNSGGALFNLYGEVIGITNAKYSSSSSGASIDNIGFAIPVNNVMDIITSIIEKGYISKPYIGVSVMDVSLETQRYGPPQGAAVHTVAADSPAQLAGLQVSDIITHVDGAAITGSSDLIAKIRQAQIGSEMILTVYRQGQTLEITVTVGEQIQEALQQAAPQQQSMPFPFSPWP